MIIRRKERDFVTVVRGNLDFRICEKSPSGSYAEGETDRSEAWLMLGFSTDAKRAQALSALDPAAEIAKVRDAYSKLFENLYIHTPDAHLDEAFMHAYLNLSYAWVYPLGWIECIQHWPTMFHMEQTGAEEWAGRAARTRDTLLSQLAFMTENGCIIEIHLNHTARRDWGGDNHFFFREALHYIRMTGDLDFARRIEPYMEKILTQTFGEYDAVGTGVLAWHTQIGNQEDFESTPGHGAAEGAFRLVWHTGRGGGRRRDPVLGEGGKICRLVGVRPETMEKAYLAEGSGTQYMVQGRLWRGTSGYDVSWHLLPDSV